MKIGEHRTGNGAAILHNVIIVALRPLARR